MALASASGCLEALESSGNDGLTGQEPTSDGPFQVRPELTKPENTSDQDPQRELQDLQRLAALESIELFDTPPEPAFDSITRLICGMFNAPVALISLVGEDRQFFKSACGLDEPWASRRETPLSHSFCQYVVGSNEPFIVNDSTKLEFLANNLAITELSVRAYLGVPIATADGKVLGALCVIDRVPRQWTEANVGALSDFAGVVNFMIESRRKEKRWRDVLNVIPQKVWSTRPDGEADFFNYRWYEFTGATWSSSKDDKWLGLIHPNDVAHTAAAWSKALKTGERYETEYRLRDRTGSFRWMLARGMPLRGANGEIERWFGTSTDIHTLKVSEEQRDVIAKELKHRIKNIFAVVASLISLSSRTRPAEIKTYAEELRSRFTALSRVYDFVDARQFDLKHQDGDRISMLELLRVLVEPYKSLTGDDRIAVCGDELTIRSLAGTALALTVHELATNAVKYGALSTPSGSVEMRLTVNDDDVLFQWNERNGPAVNAAPESLGFGSKLIGSLCAAQLGSSVQYDWALDGLKASILIDKSRIA